ncbi:hypothetical protein [Paractinoplanes hotanensis]|uniref:Lipoprotein n=1 Tax=Paractinoplanes hotanensis TaxID=2906497 RepID=A0ABT0YEC6_9ACTN|nr:hypothetical protein [Actinoplanes hotanensis]MCM4083867.1 hypothetical protein [Actinoplanes hotanensis]
MSRVSHLTDVYGRVFAVVASVFAVVFVAAGCAWPDRPPADEGVVGSEWQIVARSSPGAATATARAELTEIVLDERQDYDRLLVRFQGNRPGYRVAYRDDGRTLALTFRNARDSAQRPTANLPAIQEVSPSSTENGATATVVTLSAARLPFRVGLSIGSFYVDVAHPGAVPEHAAGG